MIEAMSSHVDISSRIMLRDGNGVRPLEGNRSKAVLLVGRTICQQ